MMMRNYLLKLARLIPHAHVHYLLELARSIKHVQ
jgi:hypothetical protein